MVSWGKIDWDWRWVVAWWIWFSLILILFIFLNQIWLFLVYLFLVSNDSVKIWKFKWLSHLILFLITSFIDQRLKTSRSDCIFGVCFGCGGGGAIGGVFTFLNDYMILGLWRLLALLEMLCDTFNTAQNLFIFLETRILIFNLCLTCIILIKNWALNLKTKFTSFFFFLFFDWRIKSNFLITWWTIIWIFVLIFL